MKIKKNNSRLVEDTDVTKADVTSDAAESRDIDNASTAEIADTIQSTAEFSGDDVSDKEALIAAIEAEEIAKRMEIESFESMVLDTAVTRALDSCWNSSRKKSEGKIRSRNLLVTGLPGSGKTAIVQSWCDAHKLRCVYIDAKNRDLPSAITGIPLRDTSSEKTAIDMAYSKFLDKLDQNERDIKKGIVGTVMFLDELNRAREDIRGSLLGLINEHKVQGDDPKWDDGYRHFEFLKFTVACINPHVQGVDNSADTLNLAELSRFSYNIDYDSNNKDALAFYTQKYNKLLSDLENAWKGDEDQKEEYIAYSRKMAIATALLTNSLHKFDGSGEFDDDGQPYGDINSNSIAQRSQRDFNIMREIHKNGFNMWNQRLMTQVLTSCDGTKASFIREAKLAKVTPKTKKMIEDCLASYRDLDEDSIALPEDPVSDAPVAKKQAPAAPVSDEVEEQDANIASVVLGRKDAGSMRSKSDILSDINDADLEADLDGISLD